MASLRSYLAPVLLAVALFFGVVASSSFLRPPDPIVTAEARPLAMPAVAIQPMRANTRTIGSGVHIGNGVIATAAHVVTDADTFFIMDEERRLFVATVIWASEPTMGEWRNGQVEDVAFLQIIDYFDGYLAEAVFYEGVLSPGQDVYAITQPAGEFMIYTRGYIAGIPRVYSYWRDLIPLNMGQITHGSSGGPVFNMEGEVIGLIVAGNMRPQAAWSMGFMIRTEALAEFYRAHVLHQGETS